MSIFVRINIAVKKKVEKREKVTGILSLSLCVAAMNIISLFVVKVWLPYRLPDKLLEYSMESVSVWELQKKKIVGKAGGLKILPGSVSFSLICHHDEDTDKDNDNPLHVSPLNDFQMIFGFLDLSFF